MAVRRRNDSVRIESEATFGGILPRFPAVLSWGNDLANGTPCLEPRSLATRVGRALCASSEVDYTSTLRAIAVCLIGGLTYAALIWALTI